MGTSRSMDWGTFRGVVLTPQEVPVCTPLINNNKEKDIEENNNKSNHIISVHATNVSVGYDSDTISETDTYEEIIKENIAYEDLIIAYPFEREANAGLRKIMKA